MVRWGARQGLVVLGLLLAVGWVGAEPPRHETRVFRVLVDGKPSGQYRMTIHHEGPQITVTSDADVRVRVLLVQYVYNYHGTEIWNGDRLMSLQSTTQDDRKHFQVSAMAEGNGIRVVSNGREHMTHRNAWPTSYWRLPPGRIHNQQHVLLDADNGRDLAATLLYVGSEQMQVGVHMRQVTHWRLTGGVQVDFWFDGHDRLVRQQSIDEGHRTELQIIQIDP